MLRVYSEYYFRGYSAPPVSFASFCCITIFVVAIFLPFLLMITTNQFWVYTTTVYEQPKIAYTGESYLNVLTTESKSYSSVARIHSAFVEQSLALYPIVSVTTEDFNNDGIADQITFNATIPTSARQVRQVNLLLGLSCEIQESAKISMKAGVFLSFVAPAGASYLKSVGDLILTQQGPFYPSKAKRYLYATQDLFSTFETSGYQAAFEAYYLRNDTLMIERSSQVVGLAGSDSSLTLEVKLRIPTNQALLYQQPLFEVMKFAWIQYVAFFVPIFAVVYYVLLWHAFRRGLLDATAQDDAAIGRDEEKLKKY